MQIDVFVTLNFIYYIYIHSVIKYTCDPEYLEIYANRSDLSIEQRTMYGYISELDSMIGTVIETLQSLGLAQNTWIIYTSDNGAPNAPSVLGRNFPLRGYKASLWEGGIRVPAFINSPLIPSERRGIQSDELYHVTDLLPTILDMAGIDVRPAQQLDGFSILDSLLNGGANSILMFTDLKQVTKIYAKLTVELYEQISHHLEKKLLWQDKCDTNVIF